jgi:formiminotetrahydrofolate cyclodeaminase
MLAARRTAEEDAEAYSTVAAALALPRQSDSERSERQQRVQEGLKGAVKPPIDTMRLAARVAHLAGELADIGNRSAISDVGTALLAAVAGYHAARLNVETNLASIRDEGWVARTRESMRDLPDPASLQTAIMQRIEAVIRGEAE